MGVNYTEADYENSVIELFRDKLGYEYIYGPDIERDFYSPLYDSILEESLYSLNRNLPSDAIQDAMYKLKNFENGELVQKNSVFMDYLQMVFLSDILWMVKNIHLLYILWTTKILITTFYYCESVDIYRKTIKRPDVISFLNGIPVVLVELKSPSREETDASDAYRQLRNYMREIPSMFIYNAICVMSDQLTSLHF